MAQARMGSWLRLLPLLRNGPRCSCSWLGGWLVGRAPNNLGQYRRPESKHMTVCRPAWIVTLALLLLPSLAGAQPSAGVPRIGVLSPAPSGAASGPPFSVFREALRSLEYVEGKDIALEFRLADGKFERLPELAADLVRLRVNVIVTD